MRLPAFVVTITPHHRNFLACVMLVVAACDDLPRDPRNTLERVQHEALRVGLIEHPPFVVRTPGEPRGVEVAAVTAFAAELGTTVEWIWGSEQKHMEALEEYELDMVIGGITAQSPWAGTVGLTKPYLTSRVSVGAAPGQARIDNIDGISVGAQRGDAIARHLESHGAIAVRIDDITRHNGPVAAPDWQLAWMGRVASAELFEEEYVIATPPGENGWIKRISVFFDKYLPTLRATLWDRQ